MQIRNLKLFFYLLLSLMVINLSSCGKEDLNELDTKSSTAHLKTGNTAGTSNTIAEYEQLTCNRLYREAAGAPLSSLPLHAVNQDGGTTISHEQLGKSVAQDYYDYGFDHIISGLRQQYPNQATIISAAEQLNQEIVSSIGQSSELNDIFQALSLLENTLLHTNTYNEYEQNLLMMMISQCRANIKFYVDVAETQANNGTASHRDDECDKWWQDIICGLVALTPAIIAGALVGAAAAASGGTVCTQDALGNMVYTTAAPGDPNFGLAVGVLTAVIVGSLTFNVLHEWCCRIFFSENLICYTPYVINPPFGCDFGTFYTSGGEDAIGYLWEVENYGDGDAIIDYSLLTVDGTIDLSGVPQVADHFTLCVTTVCPDADDSDPPVPFCIDHEFSTFAEDLILNGPDFSTVGSTETYSYQNIPHENASWNINPGFGSIQHSGPGWIKVRWNLTGTTFLQIIGTDDCGSVFTETINVTIAPY